MLYIHCYSSLTDLTIFPKAKQCASMRQNPELEGPSGCLVLAWCIIFQRLIVLMVHNYTTAPLQFNSRL